MTNLALTNLAPSSIISQPMGFGTVENQLELFDVTNQPISHLHREFPWCMLIRLRHDQLLLSGIASLIGLVMVFACGVERSKQLVRSEHAGRISCVGQAPGSAHGALPLHHGAHSTLWHSVGSAHGLRHGGER